MKAHDVMTSDVEVCAPEDTLSRVAQIMWDHDCGCVPVVDPSRRIIGMLTDRDICMTAYFRGLPLGAISVESAMAREVRTCSAEDSVKDIEDLMVEDRIRRVPVVDSEYRVVGIISLNDLALAAQHEKRLSPKKPLEKLHVAETLAALCEHRVPAASP